MWYGAPDAYGVADAGAAAYYAPATPSAPYGVADGGANTAYFTPATPPAAYVVPPSTTPPPTTRPAPDPALEEVCRERNQLQQHVQELLNENTVLKDTLNSVASELEAARTEIQHLKEGRDASPRVSEGERYSVDQDYPEQARSSGGTGTSGGRPSLGVKIKWLGNMDQCHVTSVAVEGPAYAGGIRPGDVLQRWNGRRIVNKAQWVQLWSYAELGETVRFTIFRPLEGEIELDVQLGMQGDGGGGEGGNSSPSRMGRGIGVRGSTPGSDGQQSTTGSLQVDAKLLPSENGVVCVVTYVVPNGAGERAGIQEADIIAKWNGIELLSIESFRAVKERSYPGDIVYLSVIRDGRPKELVTTLQ